MNPQYLQKQIFGLWRKVVKLVLSQVIAIHDALENRVKMVEDRYPAVQVSTRIPPDSKVLEDVWQIILGSLRDLLNELGSIRRLWVSSARPRKKSRPTGAVCFFGDFLTFI